MIKGRKLKVGDKVRKHNNTPRATTSVGTVVSLKGRMVTVEYSGGFQVTRSWSYWERVR